MYFKLTEAQMNQIFQSLNQIKTSGQESIIPLAFVFQTLLQAEGVNPEEEEE